MEIEKKLIIDFLKVDHQLLQSVRNFANRNLETKNVHLSNDARKEGNDLYKKKITILKIMKKFLSFIVKV